MAGVRAKFHCESVEKSTPATPYENVKMRPVYADSEENKTWSAATPHGSLHLCVTNEACFGKFVEGREYYVDVTAVEA